MRLGKLKKLSFTEIFIYVSVIFLVYALYTADYLVIPAVFSFSDLFLSFLFILGSFFFYSYRWKAVLKLHRYQVSLRDSTVSVGISILGKYIPGKVMTVLGQASYISEHYGYDVKRISIISFQNQIAAIWTGLAFGFLGLFYYEGLRVLGLGIFLSWGALSLLVFTNYFHCAGELAVKKILGRKIDIPKLSFSDTVACMHWYLLDFGFRTVAFYFMVKALTVQTTGYAVGFGFPLAQVIGIAAIFAPGGIGVREGILILYLRLAGLDYLDSTGISVASRLWYLIAEVAVFALAFVLRFQDRCCSVKRRVPLHQGGIESDK